MYCNHEENIKEAERLIEHLNDNYWNDLRQNDLDAIVFLLKSMVQDAITGHKKLDEILKVLECYEKPEDRGKDADLDAYDWGVKWGEYMLAKKIRDLINPQ